MKPVFQTSRLYARQLVPGDDICFFELNRDEEVIRYTGDEPFESIAEARSFLENYDHYDLHGFGRWAIIRKSDHELLGWCGLKMNEDGMVDLGYRFFRKFWNKGFATEAAKASIETGFSKFGIEEIIGRSARKNPASIRVLEKIGMTYWKDAPCLGIHNAAYYRIRKNA